MMLPPRFASLWMPDSASTVSDGTDTLFYFVLSLTGLFFVGIVTAMVYFALRYRKRSDLDRTSPIDSNVRLEALWSIVPAILLTVVFVWGFKHWVTLRVPPAHTLDVRVTARQWSWQFDYPRDGIQSDQLVVPVDTAVKLIMTSKDVLHSFYVPEFRVKQDVVPDRYTVAWFEATKVGTYNLLCAQYCGRDYSRHVTRVVVKSAEDYAAWVDNGGLEGAPEPATLGKVLYKRYGCSACHSEDGSASTGPTFQGVYGKTERFVDGSSATVDDAYIAESIRKPSAKVVAGFTPVMPSFDGKVNDKQIQAIIAYLKSLR